MTNETDLLSPDDEFAALLPWYVMGKISEPDRAKVEAYLAAHPSARTQLAVAREEADIIFAADAGLQVPHYALDKLRASLAADPSVRLDSAKSSFMDRMASAFGGFTAALSPRQLAFASMSAMLLVGVLAGMLASPFTSSQQYSVASNDAAVTQGTYALVALQPAAPAATLSAFLAENGYAIADGPRAGGIYRVRIAQDVLGDAAAETARAKLKARADLFTFVSAAPSGAAN
jgi:anti-sigma factor RsiW